MPQGWARQVGEREKFLAPHWGLNPPVQSHYTIYAILPPSYKEGDGMNITHRMGGEKIILHEDLCHTYFTYAFWYLMIHVFITFLN